ncbi:mitochondrial large subunit ribosomal protein-domain-containing protein [Poronia punctata]|nr:mitochondrial large subunit ribosomal protein-domain-containing protein [Poronia punctata]
MLPTTPIIRRMAFRAAPAVRLNNNITPICLRLRRSLTTTTTTTTIEATPTTTIAEETPEPVTKAQLPYYVGRNTLNNLGVYQKKRRGGNLLLTVLRYGEGDLMALKQDIKEALNLANDEITINSVTKQIVIKGHRRAQLLNFLYTAGF